MFILLLEIKGKIKMKLITCLLKNNICISKAEARRIIHQGSVSIDDKLINNEDIIVNVGERIKIGKNREIVVF